MTFFFNRIFVFYHFFNGKLQMDGKDAVDDILSPLFGPQYTAF